MKQLKSGGVGGGDRRESTGFAKLRRVVSTVMAVNAAYNEEQKLQEYQETLRLAIGDAVRRYIPATMRSPLAPSDLQQQQQSSEQPAFFDAEQFTTSLSEQFYAILGPELKSLGHSKDRVQKLEAELDFLSQQMQRRDELSKKQREELLRELQAANEHVRQLTMMYNDLVATTKRAKKSAQQQQQQQRTPRPHDAAPLFTSPAPTGNDDDDEDRPSSTSGNATVGGAAAGGAYVAQLVSTTVVARQLDNAWDDLDASAKIVRREEELKAEYEIKSRATLKQLRQDQSVALQKLTRKHEETLRTETQKLETKVKQLEGQLRKRELENEQVVRTERERWKSQMQRVVDSSQGKLRSVTVGLRRQCELYQMAMHDLDGHARIALESTTKELETCKASAASLEAEVQSLRLELEQSGGGPNAFGGSSAAAGQEEGLVFSSSRHNLLVIDKFNQSNVSDNNMASGGGAAVSPAAAAGRKDRSPNRKVSLVSSLNTSASAPSAPGSHQRRSKSQTMATMKAALDSATAEAAALREQLEKSEVELAVTRIARNEAIEERNAYQAQLADCSGPSADWKASAETAAYLTAALEAYQRTGGTSGGDKQQQGPRSPRMQSSANLKSRQEMDGSTRSLLNRSGTKNNLSQPTASLKSTKSSLRSPTTPASHHGTTENSSSSALRTPNHQQARARNNRSPLVGLASFTPPHDSPLQDPLHAPHHPPLSLPDHPLKAIGGIGNESISGDPHGAGSSSTSSILIREDDSKAASKVSPSSSITKVPPAHGIYSSSNIVAPPGAGLAANTGAITATTSSDEMFVLVPPNDAQHCMSLSNISMLHSVASVPGGGGVNSHRRVETVDAAAQTDPGAATHQSPGPSAVDDGPISTPLLPVAPITDYSSAAGSLGAPQLITTSVSLQPNMKETRGGDVSSSGGGGGSAHTPRRPQSAKGAPPQAVTSSTSRTENIAAGTSVLTVPAAASTVRLASEATQQHHAVNPVSIMLSVRQQQQQHHHNHPVGQLRPSSASVRPAAVDDEATRFAGAMIVTPLSPRPPTAVAVPLL